MIQLDWNTRTYRAAWSLARSFLTGPARGESWGSENVPKEGPFILACNHASFLDPPMFGCSIPREICYFARKTLFKGKFGDLITKLNSIPVDRDGADVQAIKRVLASLKQGYGVIMFPEGTRTSDGNLQKPRSGVGMIACKTQVPVVPARIFGSYECWGRHQKIPRLDVPIDVVVAPPLLPSDYDPGKEHPERQQEASERIMHAIASIERPKTSI